MPEAEVTANACPLFVNLVECGFTDRENEVTRLVAKQYLEPLIEAGVDTCILGCTHFPIISDIIRDIMGEDVTLISSSEQAVIYTKHCLEKQGLLTKRTEMGKNTFYVSDSTELFEENAANFLHADVSGNIYQAVVS
jgi:glutamate racemase